MLNARPIVKAKEPEFIWVADKPIKLGGVPKKMGIKEFEIKFKIRFSETVWMTDEFNEEDFGHDANYQSEWKIIKKYLKNPLSDRLCICYIDDKVGYGVFAREPIRAGEVVAIYTGVICRKNSLYNQDYGMSIDDNFEIDSRMIGGLARFVQHMPFSNDLVIEHIRKSPDLDTFFSRLAGAGLSFLPADRTKFEALRTVELVSEQVDYVSFLSEYNRSLDKEFQALTLPDSVKSIMAYANLRASNFIYKYRPILYFEACLDISVGEQLGVSYGRKYWVNNKRTTPEYFEIAGAVIPRDRYEQPTCKVEGNTTATTNFGFQPGFLTGRPKKKFLDIDGLLKAYSLSDNSQAMLDKGLRIAAVNNKPQDIILFIQAGSNIDAQDENPKSKRTALHWAIIKKAIDCIKELLSTGARYDIRDASDKTAYDYALEMNDDAILQLFESKTLRLT